MDMLNEKEKEKLDNIVNYIKESSDYKNYLIYKDKISHNDELKRLIENVKNLEKKYIRSNKDNITGKKLEDEIYKLNNYNDYVMYNYYLDRVNTYLELTKNKINEYFDNLFNEKLF